MRGSSSIVLVGIAVALACGSGASSDDGGTAATSAGRANGGASPGGAGGTSGAAGNGLGGTVSGAGAGGSAGASGVSGSVTGGNSGAGSGGADGTGDGGDGGWLCQASDGTCTCGPVTDPNVADCGTTFSCCFFYVNDSGETDRDVCTCDDLPDPDCTERLNGLLAGRREATCPP